MKSLRKIITFQDLAPEFAPTGTRVSAFFANTRLLTFLKIAFSVAGLLSGASCQPQADPGPDYGSAPRKPVPAEFVGEWLSTSVSGTNVVRPNGHTVPAWSFGSLYHLNADGTGFSLVTASTATYTSENTERVEEDGTFEIETTGDGLIFKFYPIRGKLYDNDVFMHDVDPAKLYPQTYIDWACTLGENSRGRYFQSGDLIYYKKE